MEAAPLTLAYTHARNAAQETKRSNPVAASEEHDLAAAEFATAAASTTDKEALRVLRLLEQHHKQLALILKDAHSKPASHDESGKRNVATATVKAGDSSQPLSQPPRLTRTTRTTARDLSSSIASNLASARGIPMNRQKRMVPASPLVSNEYADGTFTQDSGEHKRSTSPDERQSNRPSWAPPENVHAKTTASPPTSDSPFQNFYNRFEGVISTLTAPLAFASLPLSQSTTIQKDEPKPLPVQQQSPRKNSAKEAPSQATLDYSKLISNAALRAVRNANEPGYSKPHESFLLVPTSGGTMSYADITAANYVDRQVSRNRHKRELSNTSIDDFVDASSQILPQPPVPSLMAVQAASKGNSADRWGGSQNQPKYQGKTMEELHLENQVLRKTQNEIAKRLHAFELTAQDARLAQSIRSLQLSPVTTPENSRGKMLPVSGGGPGSDAGIRMAQRRIEELEETLRKNDRRLTKREEENAKLKETLGKYRDKWEGLKAGAKARREQAGGDKTRRATGTSSPALADAANHTKDKDTVEGAKDDT